MAPSLTAAVLCLSLLALLLALLRGRSKPTRPFPPGPRPWPVVGNLPDLFLLQRRLRQPPHAVLAAVARAHGPLVHLRLGVRSVVVASSPSAASQVLKARDRELSGRYVPAALRVPDHADYSLPWAARCDDHWRWMRALCKGEVFSIRRVEAQAGLREGKAREMVELLLRRQGEEVKVGELAFRTIFNILGNMLFSRDVLAAPDGEEGGEEEGGEGSNWNLKKAMCRLLHLGMKPNLEDFYAAVFGGLDLQGLRREARKNVDMIFGVFDGVIRERRAEMEEEGTGGKEDFLKVLLGAGCDDAQLKALFLDIFTAGTDTSTTLVEWTMSELVKNPQVMARLREELQRVVGSPDGGAGAAVRESHLAHLPYLQACIKETLRLHPPVPMLLPRRAADACEVMGYEVPRDSVVLVNVWMIGRDPELWTDPLRFLPERFLEACCSVDYKGMDFEFVPFGAGRRICPGLPVAARVAPLLVASMVHGFEWHLPGDQTGAAAEERLGMGERLGLVLEREQPLVLVPKPITVAAGQFPSSSRPPRAVDVGLEKSTPAGSGVADAAGRAI